MAQGANDPGEIAGEAVGNPVTHAVLPDPAG